MTIIDNYLLREAGRTWLGVFLVLLVIMVGSGFTEFLPKAAEGTLTPDALFNIVLINVIGLLEVLIPVSVLLAVMLALGRLYQDSEVTVISACGIGMWRLAAPILLLASVLAIPAAAVSFHYSPWGARLLEQMREEARTVAQLRAFEPGQFRKLARGRAVFYVESVTPDGEGLERIFVHLAEDHGKVAVMSADRGVQREDSGSGERILVLENGRRYDGTPGRQDFRTVGFSEHGVRFVPKITPTTRSKIGMTPTPQLLGGSDPAEIAELQKRLATPISVVLLALLAVPLSYLTPRQGRYGKVVVGIFIYAIYSNLLGISQVWIAEGRIPSWLGMWWAHVLLLVLGCALIMIREMGGSPRKRTAPA